MFTIDQLKMRGRGACKKNYWKAVLVAIVISLACGSQGSSGLISTVVSFTTQNLLKDAKEESGGHGRDDDKKIGRAQERRHSGGSYEEWDGMDPYSIEEHLYSMDPDELEEYLNSMDPESMDELYDMFNSQDFEDLYDYDYSDSYDKDANSGLSDLLDRSVVAGAAAAIIALVMAVMFIISLIALLIKVFLYNPLEVGCRRFFVANLVGNGQIASLGYAFDHRYRNQVYVLFMRDLFRWLWGLLCVIPGIYKGYEYLMIPYLLSEYPDLKMDQAFSISRQMMNGYKMKAFMLDLSFIGWWILNFFTAGLLGTFYVNPYYNSTKAAFYEALKGYNGIPGIREPMWTKPAGNTAANDGWTAQAGDVSSNDGWAKPAEDTAANDGWTAQADGGMAVNDPNPQQTNDTEIAAEPLQQDNSGPVTENETPVNNEDASYPLNENRFFGEDEPRNEE